jgi:hypothetical protein
MADAIASVPAKSDWGAFRWGAKNLPVDPTTSYTSKTVLITGLNIGLGFEAATKFVALGALKLIFGVYLLEKGKEVKAAIK